MVIKALSFGFWHTRVTESPLLFALYSKRRMSLPNPNLSLDVISSDAALAGLVTGFEEGILEHPPVRVKARADEVLWEFSRSAVSPERVFEKAGRCKPVE